MFQFPIRKMGAYSHGSRTRQLHGGSEFQYGGQAYELPVDIRRTELTRSELLGRLGMVPVKKDEKGNEQKRFSISYLNSKEFFERLSQLVLGTGSDALVIPCKKEEYEQFDI